MSRVRRKSHARFLEGLGLVTAPGYPVRRHKVLRTGVTGIPVGRATQEWGMISFMRAVSWSLRAKRKGVKMP